MYILEGKMVWFQPSVFLISEHSLFNRNSDTFFFFFWYSVEMRIQEKLRYLALLGTKGC